MTLEQVHFTQHVYRKLLDSMSRPGDITTLTDGENRFIQSFNCYLSTSSLLLTLLDQDVTYHLISEDSINISTKITAYTLANHVPAKEADFIIVLANGDQAKMEHALKKCKVGTLRDPHLSATWIFEADRFSRDELTLSGPGIKTEATIQLQVPNIFWDLREERNKEFPLGIDCVFTNNRNEITCIPRTTMVERVGIK
ncbi:phosphonate C-P lyase system protein PhnH [Pseudogracilibacillus auburnensis]|uniref:Alpha-D-ribose 1-methylphosphonate 5-triphosphate synthase subunit PhnH n=1 Tax=Pseudogracilibacillus auburnensis TaxID=1494959 RepID=A0A2V3W9R2_9BACI|nr:phosphonate C-P lyase system protein PhnH [Pseudogracilibacillus auburnensis]PXW90276.1 alpha-D-ribose 1-methylphosphonate 5-triphosphate synthase subunit PhnH [Pseudogracilibacillus auburnensis]